MENDEVLTTYEVSKYLNISKPTYLKLIRLRKIEAVKVGNSWRVLRSGLYRFLTGGKKGENLIPHSLLLFKLSFHNGDLPLGPLHFTCLMEGTGSIDLTGALYNGAAFSHPLLGYRDWSYTHATIYQQTSPVPEPATMLLVGSGLMGLAWLRKKFKK